MDLSQRRISNKTEKKVMDGNVTQLMSDIMCEPLLKPLVTKVV